ncbi:MAG TPA: pitrilysin family protein [Candidatus Saccharimonadales bacterium]|nr:pitrilysin family protein [Candidatus Saccharimonadales bacterium]
MQFKRTLLPNGLRVITIPMPSLESATVIVMVGAGSRYENKANNGISHFFEHMAFKGTEKRPSAMEISSLIDGIGGEFNAFTGKEITGYYIKSAKGKLETLLDLLSDMLQNSKLDPVEIDKERGVIMEEINMIEDNPMRKLGDIYEELMYGDTPMGWDIAGPKENIQTITQQNFRDYMGGLYSADNMTVVVAGGIESEPTETLVEKYFGGMKQFITGNPVGIVENQTKPAVFIKTKKTEQIHIALGVRTISLKSPKKYPLSVLAAILGGGMSSRLFHEVREKRGLAYYIRTNSDEYTDAGTLVSTAGIDPKRVVEAIEVILSEYKKVGEGKMELSDKELTKAKEFLKGHLVLGLEDSNSVAGFYGHQELLEEEIENPDQILAHLDAVTKEDVEAVGREFFIENTLNLALIGNFEDRQKLESLLKL